MEQQKRPQRLYCRKDSPTRGRHLRAANNNRPIPKGTLVFCERPLLALQSLDNVAVAWTCHFCHAFVGGPDMALERRFKNVATTEFWDKVAAAASTNANEMIVSCRRACGHVFCSADCERDAWELHHCLLCTGNCEDENDALVRYKELAATNNEILLLVAEWWVAQHLAATTSTKSDEPDPYCDFVMEPWWNVVTMEAVAQSDGLGDANALEESIRTLCEEAAELLNDALNHDARIPTITSLDIAKRVGACEQNAMGIRQRSPLCRSIFDRDFREANHDKIVRCLGEAGFIAANEDDVDNGDGDGQVETDYSVDEIADFLAGLFIDETGCVIDQNDPKRGQQRDTTGDDFDYIFPPCDGTAMYSIACKMNHSCDPNIIAQYRPSSWGPQHPLTLYCVALREIEPDEELTISYIDGDKTVEERQRVLCNYGFACGCARCVRELAIGELKDEAPIVLPSDVFGSDSDDEDDAEALPSENSEQRLQQRLSKLDGAWNHCEYGSIPISCSVRARTFIGQLVHDIESTISSDASVASQLRLLSEGSRESDLCLLLIVGEELANKRFTNLSRIGKWVDEVDKEIFWCSTIAAVLGYAHLGHMLRAMTILDRGFALGVSRYDTRLETLYQYVDRHAASMYAASRANKKFVLPCFSDEEVVRELVDKGLSKPLTFLANELQETPSVCLFQSTYVRKSTPVVIRGYASHWPAISAWRDLHFFRIQHGNRLVPVELGSMVDNSMCETMMPLRTFIETYLFNTRTVWSLDDAVRLPLEVAYLAQHPLVDQIDETKQYLDPSPKLVGQDGPSRTNMWVGSGGTRTPLHFDSYENLFVQMVGVKYIRFYDQKQTPKLYPNGGGKFGQQGNMSELNCELEGKEHPLAESAEFTEVLLFPGDSVYIPAGTWHYVRSITPSISVNYWF